MSNPAIKVGYLVSYDYNYLKYSLPTVYKEADIIVLAIDKDRKTWRGETFEIAPSFFEWVKEYDIDHKVKIYEDSFFQAELTAMECETRERKMLTQFMGHGDWHVQIDSDEYILDFKSVVAYLKSLDIKVKTLVYAEMVTIFKQDANDFFMIDKNDRFPLATNEPIHLGGRNLQQLEKNIYTKFKVLHQSWGRTEEELSQKLRNWGHRTDFNTEAYFNLWKAINKDTYKYIQNFHPLDFYSWKSLVHVEAKDIPELIEKTKATLLFEKQENKKSKFLSFFSRKKK